jgi:hypothetical protein
VRRPWPAAAGVFALAWALRLAFLGLEPATQLVGDERAWRHESLVLAADPPASFDPLRNSLIFYPPLFPYVFAGLHLAFGLGAVKVAQTLAGALLAPAVALFGWRALGPRTGLLAGLIAATYPEHVWYSAHLWAEPLFMAFLWWGLERLLAADTAESGHPAVAAGMAFGLAALTRESSLYLAPLGAAWLAWRRPARLRPAAVFLAATLLTVAPWTVRNAVRFGAFVPVSLMGARVAWMGNTPLDHGQFFAAYDEEKDPIAAARRATREAVRNVLERQPGWILEKLAAEMPEFWALDNLAIIHVKRGAYGPVTPAAAWAVALVTLVPYLLVLAGSVLALPRLPRTRPVALLLLVIAFFVLLHTATMGFSRYRLPVMPALFVVAAFSLVARSEGAPPLRGARALAALVLALAFLACLAVDLPAQLREPAFGLARPAETGDPP